MAVATRQSHWVRAADALRAVLPSAVDFASDDAAGLVLVGGQSLRPVWISAGNLGDARMLLDQIVGEDTETKKATVAVAKRLSPGARHALSQAGISWVDESGAVEITSGTILVSHPGQPPEPKPRLERWTPAALAVAEALLVGTKPTVKETKQATGLSSGACTNALRFLTDQGLLEAAAERGRGSARVISDHGSLLGAYATAAADVTVGFSISVGAVWQDPIAGLIEAGTRWDSAGTKWVSTGVAAASVLAPLLTTVTSTEVYIGTATLAGLVAAARDVGLTPIEGGRLTLRTPPTVAVLGLAEKTGGLRVAPWPRVFVDLRRVGVRGEEAAEHLREIEGQSGSRTK